jgi:hypothetical protein
MAYKPALNQQSADGLDNSANPDLRSLSSSLDGGWDISPKFDGGTLDGGGIDLSGVDRGKFGARGPGIPEPDAPGGRLAGGFSQSGPLSSPTTTEFVFAQKGGDTLQKQGRKSNGR